MNESHAFAPTLSGLVGPPGAVLAIAELHLHTMRATPAFRWCLLAFGLILSREALQERFQPGQQARFVAVPERHLDFAASQGDVAIDAGGGFRERPGAIFRVQVPGQAGLL